MIALFKIKFVKDGGLSENIRLNYFMPNTGVGFKDTPPECSQRRATFQEHVPDRGWVHSGTE